MKKLNKGRFLRAKSQIYDNEFHVTSFPGRTQNYPPPPPFYCLPFHQPTPFILIPFH